MTAAITRRDFILALLGTISLVSLEACSVPADPSSFGSLLFRGRRLDKGPIVAFTNDYLSRHPEETHPATLVRRLFGRNPGTDPAAIKEALSARVREDFEKGRTVNLDGWLLSLTEVRLWCLYLVAVP